jgi:hypothetical protein
MLANQMFVGPCCMEVVACAAWNIWSVQKDLIFQEQAPSFGQWRASFQLI